MAEVMMDVGRGARGLTVILKLHAVKPIAACTARPPAAQATRHLYYIGAAVGHDYRILDGNLPASGWIMALLMPRYMPEVHPKTVVNSERKLREIHHSIQSKGEVFRP